MKLDRLMGILTVLLQNDSVTAPYLAERFEVSRRTINRDIDALCQAGIPVITRQGGKGGISIAEGFKLNNSVLTSEELSSIVAALKGIGSVSETSQTMRLLDKLSVHDDSVVSLRESIIIDMASYHKGSLTKKIEAIKRAIGEYRIIEFDYYYEKGEIHRSIEPYFIVFQWMNWYVFGYCPLRQDFRMFKLNRLWNLELCSELYTLQEIPASKRDFYSQFTDDYTLVALFHPSVRYQLIEAYGLDCYTETKTGELRFEVPFTNEDYILSWLLGFGGKVKVLEPLSIIEGLRGAAEKIMEHYERT